MVRIHLEYQDTLLRVPRTCRQYGGAQLSISSERTAEGPVSHESVEKVGISSVPTTVRMLTERFSNK
jgi:hypothetical protein